MENNFNLVTGRKGQSNIQQQKKLNSIKVQKNQGTSETNVNRNNKATC